MRLLYKKVCFDIVFSEPVDFYFPPAFLWRSVIGAQLRKMCCVQQNIHCNSCMLNSSCVYCCTFESIIDKANGTMPGRDRISHPVILDTPVLTAKQLDSMKLNIIFLGASTKYIPYYYIALLKSGEDGILKQKTNFTIKDVRVQEASIRETSIKETSIKEASILLCQDKLDTQKLIPDVWEFKQNGGGLLDKGLLQKQIIINFITPLRFKTQGAYNQNFSASDFMSCLHRRTQTLCAEYGSIEGDEKDLCYHPENLNITEKALIWKDYHHYSARQQKAIRLGGLLGTMKLEGGFSGYETALLGFAALFHAGKNTHFGFGKIDVNSTEGREAIGA